MNKKFYYYLLVFMLCTFILINWMIIVSLSSSFGLLEAFIMYSPIYQIGLVVFLILVINKVKGVFILLSIFSGFFLITSPILGDNTVKMLYFTMIQGNLSGFLFFLFACLIPFTSLVAWFDGSIRTTYKYIIKSKQKA
ncbi:hypothetical protein [Francisella frigiditurris]|uniref:Putative membrane protein n=1 Tax=Francisella frigiditurris TaxID=1542390 RepID=A0A1J0KWD0_9GAMM|nr:hypothetical protein [Francisella frigiditurris]APC97986.1 putative membrane protein [Francisella frigiditurris]